MKRLLLPTVLLYSLSLCAQVTQPAGSVQYEPEKGICITPQRYSEIASMLEENVQALQAKGILPSSDAKNKTTATKLDWPLRQAAGFNYNSYYRIGNFVDHNQAFPNQLEDWNCGTRTYDLASGSNHNGMDISIWPFAINMMDAGQVEIIAAADGVIIGKEDGNFDKNCAMGSGNWNAVYLKHTDGTVTWYGHMKSGSTTTKAIGASVTKGEYLGLVGSSGSSTGPHLHFEVHDNSGNVVDPYHGNCNSAASMWTTQKPYYESTINRLMTHFAPPGKAECPLPDTINARDTFSAGQKAYFAAYYHDNTVSNVTDFKVYDPSNTVFKNWSYTPTATYSSSYYYWSYTLPDNPALGKWKFEAVYEGKTITHEFYVLFPTSITEHKTSQVRSYPNPSRDYINIETECPGNTIHVSDMLGRAMFSGEMGSAKKIDVRTWPEGVYTVRIMGCDAQKVSKFLVR